VIILSIAPTGLLIDPTDLNPPLKWRAMM